MLRQQIDRHHRPGGIRQHRHDAREKAHRPGETFVLRQRQEILSAAVQEPVKDQQRDDDPADHHAGHRIVKLPSSTQPTITPAIAGGKIGRMRRHEPPLRLMK